MGLEVPISTKEYDLHWDPKSIEVSNVAIDYHLDDSTGDFSIVWNVQQQKGYKYTSQQRSVAVELHKEIEDSYFPLKSTPKSEYVSIHGDSIFILADGHSGHEAAMFFISQLSKKLLNLLNSRKYDFSSLLDQQTLSGQITEIFVELDNHYTSRKIEEYKRWVGAGSRPTEKPVDDGCTMVVNILQKGWVLNCNVGDSRTVLCRPSVYQKEWIPFFASSDHNMMNPVKVSDISKKGGKFLDPTGTMILNVRVEPPECRGGRLYRELSNSRLYRPQSDIIRAVGCSHKRTLNLTGTMGDLLFKIHPPVLSCIPDFSFVRLEGPENVLIMATDGIWDHLYTDSTEYQNEAVVEKVMKCFQQTLELPVISSSWDSAISDETRVGDPAEEALGVVCDLLIDRESLAGDLYTPRMMRYDDATLMLIHITQ
jgi:serine/threonine protein phosphatase PrpC